ncbi:hypothetical protein RF11_10206 [Thelohanellus kitauei]|uniref:K Homology domain-containing protein n=1 Tax=Thelohanellus kitauei TaxID=669202 RepID=A0A0C2IWB2_THEKT|nr:hypothetical protein RF11_10206 [Thelohanellus kitauei]
MYQSKQHKDANYLRQLIDERMKMCTLEKRLVLIENMIDKEIQRVRGGIDERDRFPYSGRGSDPNIKSEPVHPVKGQNIILAQKLYFAVDRYPTYNFTGRIIGPKGQILKELEKATSCRIHIRGRGSTRIKGRTKHTHQQEAEHGDPANNEPLHVAIYAEDIESRARMKMQHAIQVVKPFLGADKDLIDIQTQLVREPHYHGYRPVDIGPIIPRRGVKRSKQGMRMNENPKKKFIK